jgi:hypothetical protein
MKKAIVMTVVVLMVCICSFVQAQPMQASQQTEVIGTICKTMDQHPAPTPEADYDLMDYAVCGEGGLRVYPSVTASEDFMDIDKGVQGGKPGKEVVYLSGYTRTTVLPSFGPGAAGQPRFRFTWREVETINRDIKFVKNLKVSKAGEMARIEMTIVNPLGKAINGTRAELDIKSNKHFAPYQQTIQVIRPHEERTVSFDVPRNGGMPHGTFTIKNSGSVYIDIARSF